MCHIPIREYRQRLDNLQNGVRGAGLDVFVVSAFDSIYYLTGAGFEPLERPFFLIVRPDEPPTLLVPKLDHEHMKKAHNIAAEQIQTYAEYPAPPRLGWPDRLRDEIATARQIGIEPTLRQEIAQELADYSIRVEPLIERLRLVKSSAEIDMIRRAAHYADFGVERLLVASYYGASVAEGFAETRTVNGRILREVEGWDPLTTKVLLASWAAPHSAMPHSIPNLSDRLHEGPHVALSFLRVNGYAAESERTYFTAPPSTDACHAFAAMVEARRLAFDMLRPGVAACEIDGRVNEFLGREGFAEPDQRLHRTGHGIGLGNHEAPWIAEGSTDRLAENMVISIEPGIYLRGIGGFRHSDTVLITRAGCELLTRLPTGIDHLTISAWKPLTRMSGRLLRSKLRLSR
jgi:Xaa-Pro dipeptidase